jgi:hypothetical protein
VVYLLLAAGLFADAATGRSGRGSPPVWAASPFAANAALDVLTEGADPELLVPPVNVWRLALHPRGLAARVGNLASWGRHVVESLRARAPRSPDPALDELLLELAGYLPDAVPDPDYLGFAVPVRLRWRGGELRLLTALTSLVTAVDVALAELHLEAWLPADQATADALRDRSGGGELSGRWWAGQPAASRAGRRR